MKFAGFHAEILKSFTTKKTANRFCPWKFNSFLANNEPLQFIPVFKISQNPHF